MARPVTRRLLAAAALVGATTLVLSACGSDSDAGTVASTPDSSAPFFSQLPQDVQDAGRLTVATSVGYPPFEVYDTDGTTIVGIDPDVAAALEDQLGVPLEFQDTKFDGIIPGLEAGRYDMAMSGMSDTLARQEQVDFVDYFAAGPGLLTLAENASTYTSLESLCGTSVAVTSGTITAEDAATQSTACEAEGKGAITITTFGADSESIQALKTGRADVFVVDSASGATVAAESDGAFELTTKYRDVPFGIVVPKGSELGPVIQQALQAMVADGSYAQILQDWDQPQGALAEITINGGTV